MVNIPVFKPDEKEEVMLEWFTKNEEHKQKKVISDTHP